MIIYTITLDGDYITFVETSGKERSHRKTTVKELETNASDDNLTLVSIDNTTTQYNYTEVEDPGTPSVAFVDLDTFRSYILTNLT
jgi:hypothetical protein